VAASRTIVIAGGGIGGLTAALALAQRGFRIAILEQASQLEEVGAGLQLSPNATHVLIGLGLGDALRAHTVSPEAVRVVRAHSAREITRIPLADAERRYGAPYWVLRRGDLQTVLLNAVKEHPDISLELGTRVETFATHSNGVTVKAMRTRNSLDVQGIAFVGADGLWSTVRAGLGDAVAPKFARRVAWRALLPAEMAPPAMREPLVTLWLGSNGHVVHYPVQAGSAINIVAIAKDSWNEPGWSTTSTPAEVLARFPAGKWSRHLRDLLGAPARWLKWALVERPVARTWGRDQMTMLGDAAHPTLPFLAQGAGLAIEDAAVLAMRLAESPDDPAPALRRYESDRRDRAAKVMQAARKTGKIYQYGGPDAAVRNIVMRRLGGALLRRRYDWIYSWHLDPKSAGSGPEKS
jgi:salicylate hydroxylase